MFYGVDRPHCVSAFIHQWACGLCLPVGCCESCCYEHHVQVFVWTCVPNVAESDWGGYLGTCQVRIGGEGLSISAFYLLCLPTCSFPIAGTALTSPPKATWTPNILARLWGRLFSHVLSTPHTGSMASWGFLEAKMRSWLRKVLPLGSSLLDEGQVASTAWHVDFPVSEVLAHQWVLSSYQHWQKDSVRFLPTGACWFIPSHSQEPLQGLC